MRILLIMDPGLPVPPPLYGGHERLVHLFAEEYHRKGHEVNLFVGPDSRGPGKVYVFGRNGLNRPIWDTAKEIVSGWTFLSLNHKKYDLIHNFGRLIYLLPILNKPVKKIMTYGRRVTPYGIKWINYLPSQNLIFTACSDFCVKSGNVSGTWKTVYNAIDFSKYTLRADLPADAPLIFLGRLDRVKGPHLAIKAALKTGEKLIIAGNKPTTPDNISFFRQHVEPFIDGNQIKYIGAVNDEQKNEILGKCKALLFPISSEEAFGLVMIEAMACGTPVIGFNKAAVPEVITAKTGFIVNNFEEMCHTLEGINRLNRTLCRDEAQKRFDKDIIANDYLRLFNVEEHDVQH